MADRNDDNTQQSIWERPEPRAKPVPVSLSRETIIAHAISLADAQGLEAASLRKVAASLGAGPMRLYSYFATKQELLDVMIDAVYAEINAAGVLTGTWREKLLQLALRTRDAANRHLWFVDLFGGRPHQGPNALVYLEASLAALYRTPGFEDIDDVLRAIKTVNAYIIGGVKSEAAEHRQHEETGQTKTEWQDATGGYLFRMIATGKFPTIDAVVRDGTMPDGERAFEKGFQIVLDGIESAQQNGMCV